MGQLIRALIQFLITESSRHGRQTATVSGVLASLRFKQLMQTMWAWAIRALYHSTSSCSRSAVVSSGKCAMG